MIPENILKLVPLILKGLMSKINRKIFNGIPGMLHCSIYWVPRWKFLANIFIVGCLNKLECELWACYDLVSYFAEESQLVLYICQEEWRNQVGGSLTRSSLKVCADSVSRNLAPEERIIQHGYLLLKWQRPVSCCLHSSLRMYVDEIFTGRYIMIYCLIHFLTVWYYSIVTLTQ